MEMARPPEPSALLLLLLLAFGLAVLWFGRKLEPMVPKLLHDEW